MFRKVLLFVLLAAISLLLGWMGWQEVLKRKHSTIDNPPVARVYHQYLYRSDLKHLTAEANGPEDKSEMTARYIQSWIAKQLMIAAAEAHSDYDKVDIERRVLDYRYALLVHNFVEKQVNEQLNREVSPEEIASYYQAHQENFLLRNHIFKGQFIVLPKEAPDSVPIKTLLLTNRVEKRALLQTYCCKFAQSYSLEADAWLQWDELIRETPFNKIKDQAKLLSRSSLLQTSNEKYNYYFKIHEYKRANEVSPLELVSDQIADIIVYKRKIDLANKIKEEILQKAQKNNDCIIYEY